MVMEKIGGGGGGEKNSRRVVEWVIWYLKPSQTWRLVVITGEDLKNMKLNEPGR